MLGNRNIVAKTIGKVLNLFRKAPPQPCKHVRSTDKFTDPTYPSDLSELLPENRTETHTDTCLWQRLEPEDK